MLRFCTSLAAVCAVFTALCAQTTSTLTVDVDGVTRSYVLYVPASYVPGTAAPLLFNFHGYTSNATQQMGYGDFRPIADVEGFLIAHPQGLDLPGTAANDPHWNVGGWTTASQSNDLGFTDAMIADISATYSIDAARIYSTGFSNGGFFSFELACKRSNVIAAIGSVAGTITPQQEAAGCAPVRAVPVVQIHGTSDGTIPYAVSSGYSEPVSDAITAWRGYNGASVAVAPVSIDPNGGDGTTVDHFRYETPTGASLVEHYRVNSGSHTWPGAAFNQPGTSYDIDAAQVVWDFVSQFSLPAALPVELSAFTARAQDRAVRLDWVTSLEIDAAYFAVERRTTTEDWRALGTMAARNRASAYTWTDEQPAAGINYYRLRTVDFDGSTAVSPVVTAEVTAAIRVYPNPADGTLYVAQESTHSTQYRLYDARGRVVRRGSLQAGRSAIAVADLPAGAYRLVVGDRVLPVMLQ